MRYETLRGVGLWSFELAGARSGKLVVVYRRWSHAGAGVGASSSLIEAGGGGTTSSGFSGGCVLVISGEVLVVSRRFTGDGAVGFWLDEEDGMKAAGSFRWLWSSPEKELENWVHWLWKLTALALCSSEKGWGFYVGFSGGTEAEKRKKEKMGSLGGRLCHRKRKIKMGLGLPELGRNPG
ncbi:hypothetical protein KY289_036242 [Solanum tuberosum]|nr:hypothetical protein KY289_036242 [Solanum tuberosum]